MTAEQFEDYLIGTRAQLMKGFQNPSEITDLDVYMKTVMDFQEHIAKALFKEIYGIKEYLSSVRGDLLADNRERYTDVMGELKSIKGDK
jgi:hypothetical protein